MCCKFTETNRPGVWCCFKDLHTKTEFHWSVLMQIHWTGHSCYSDISNSVSIQTQQRVVLNGLWMAHTNETLVDKVFGDALTDGCLHQLCIPPAAHSKSCLVFCKKLKRAGKKRVVYVTGFVNAYVPLLSAKHQSMFLIGINTLFCLMYGNTCNEG